MVQTLIVNGAPTVQPGSKLFSISGDVGAPGVYEIPLGMPMMDFFELAGGIQGDLAGLYPRGFIGACINGRRMCEAAMDYESLAGLKSMLGSGAVCPFNTDRDPVQMLLTLTRFYAHESCGQCTPCREGTGYADRVLKKVGRGEGHDGDIEFLRDLADQFNGTTICPLAIADAWPIESFTAKFREHFDAYIAKNDEADQAERELTAHRPGGFM